MLCTENFPIGSSVSILFCKAIEEAFPFSLQEHATTFGKDLWFNTLLIQSWLDTFSAHRHIGTFEKPYIFETLNIAGIASIRNKVPQEIWLRVRNLHEPVSFAINTGGDAAMSGEINWKKKVEKQDLDGDGPN
ncbi:hypothetical protein Ahy_A09g044137 [Arachis hypogaea]|uniref:Uncharacterized protein n=1 Tax=Arachis hypogaea TaxID=3818 RepID=A0A445BJL0_ARAHY|nr:hypothetical protein Ahy_A09g044137 [Arachis hypogaea]